MQFSVVIGDSMPLLYSICMCEAKISICNRWKLEEFKTTCKLVFNRTFLEAFSLFLVIFCTNQNQTKPNQTKRYIWTQVIANIDNNNKTFKHLPNSNWFDHLCFFFLPFKQFISSWSLWGNSTYPDELPRVEIPKPCRRTTEAYWIR